MQILETEANSKELVLVLKNFGLKFGDRTLIENFSFEMKNGEFVSFLGLNGSGKTTTLKAICGLSPYSGQVLVNNSPPSLVFQSPQLLPWLSIFENLLICNPKQADSINKWLTKLNLIQYKDYRPAQISGGTQQKIALIRALLFNSKFVVMDEPFSSLDLPQRQEFHKLIYEIWIEYQANILMVSHDVEEAILLSQKVYLFSKSKSCVEKMIEIPFSYPRDPKRLRLDPIFLHLKEEINSFLISDYDRKSLS